MSSSLNELEVVLKRANEICTTYKLKYVTNEQLFCALIEYKPVYNFLKEHNTRVDDLISTYHDYFNSDSSLIRMEENDNKIVMSTTFSRVMTTAKAHSLLFGKDTLEVVNILYILLSDGLLGKKFCKSLVSAGADVPKIISELKSASEIVTESDTVSKPKPKEKENVKKEKPVADEQKILEEFCVNVTELAKSGKIDPVIGRDKDIHKILQVLGRKNKQNAILVGESGTGKTSILDGLANAIVNKQVPSEFENSKLFSLDIGSLVAGTKFRGDFEERLKNIIKALANDKDAILFIDEIHMIRGAGGTSDNAMDASNILKPALTNRSIRVIGATTQSEYTKHFEKDKALMRRFFKIEIAEPSVSDTKDILHAAIHYFETFHNVTYEKDAIDLSVDLAYKYMHDKRFPDKAFDIIDSVGSRIKLSKRDSFNITIEDIEDEVSNITKIPKLTVKKDNKDKLMQLDVNLKKSIYGQDHVVETVSNYVWMAKSGLRDAEKPLLCALFRGMSGSGKTELSKQLAKELDIPLVRFDMSEYQEKHSVSKLIGSPPGYVGHGDGDAGSGLLITAIENSPHCVLLLDEIEKSDPQVTNILLQVMDYGTLTSSIGKVVSFRNVIIIMSANLGAKMMDKSPIGFGRDTSQNTHDEDATADHFSPEFRNRLDMAVTFNKLDKTIMLKIVDKFIKETNDLLVSKGINITLSDKAKNFFIEETINKNLGARPIGKLISEKIKQPLSKKILFENLPNGSEIFVDYIDGEMKLKTQAIA